MDEYEKIIKKHLKDRGWDNLRPADVAKSIVIEAGELLELFQWTNQTLEEVKKDKNKMESIKSELADVLNYCFEMAVLLELSTEKIVKNKLKKVKAKYPAHLFKNDTTKTELELEKIYLKIKKEHRMKGE